MDKIDKPIRGSVLSLLNEFNKKQLVKEIILQRKEIQKLNQRLKNG